MSAEWSWWVCRRCRVASTRLRWDIGPKGKTCWRCQESDHVVPVVDDSELYNAFETMWMLIGQSSEFEALLKPLVDEALDEPH